MNELPAPIVPAEVDLRDFAFMPLEFRRLFAAETWILGNPEERIACLALWCESWHQVPSASLPDDDRVLAHLSQAGQRWKRLRNHALRGWMKCSDGRLYHPVVAEKALEAWHKKVEQRQRTLNARIAALEKRLTGNVTATEKEHLQEQLQTLRESAKGTKGREGKRREGIKKEEASPPAPSAPPLTAAASQPELLSAPASPEPIVERIPLCDGTEFEVPKSMRDELDRLYPAVDPDQTLREIRGWNLAKPNRRKTRRGVKAHIFDWFAREQDKQSRRAA